MVASGAARHDPDDQQLGPSRSDDGCGSSPLKMNHAMGVTMPDIRIVPCECCGSEGRIYRGQYEDERDCGQCPVCEGTGSMEITVEPATLEDLSDGAIYAAVSRRIHGTTGAIMKLPKGHTELSKDERPISGIFWPTEQSPVVVGENSVTSIEAYDECGSMSHVPWLAVIRGDDGIILRVPADHVSVSYVQP